MNTPLRLENESEKAWTAFDAYVQMGEKRSIRNCAQQLNKSVTILARYSKRHRWLERIAAQQRREAEMKIRAEERATQAVAIVTEERVAALAERITSLAYRTTLFSFARFLAVLTGDNAFPRLIEQALQLHHFIERHAVLAPAFQQRGYFVLMEELLLRLLCVCRIRQ